MRPRAASVLVGIGCTVPMMTLLRISQDLLIKAVSKERCSRDHDHIVWMSPVTDGRCEDEQDKNGQGE